MTAIRTVVVTIPPIIADVVMQLLSSHVDLDVVCSLNNRFELAAQLAMLSPNLVILGLSPGETDGIATMLLRSVPFSRIVALSSDGRNAYIHRMRACRQELANVSPDELSEAILCDTDLHQSMRRRGKSRWS